MISIARQKELFDGILDSLNSIEGNTRKISLVMPILDLQCNLKIQNHKKILDNNENRDLEGLYDKFHHYPDDTINSHILDELGYFDASRPDRVFLCDALIKYTVERWLKRLQPNPNVLGFIDKVHWIHEQSHRIPNLLAEVVYIHECAHYVHFHINSVDFINWAVNERTLYVETFAQLITDRMVKKSDVTEVKHCQIFDKLREQQSIEYTRYYDVKLGLLNYNALVIVETFLNLNNRKNLESEQGVIKILVTNYFDNWKADPTIDKEAEEFNSLYRNLHSIGQFQCASKNLENSWSFYDCRL
ncbi:MAG: hypothetical protein EXR20_08410 [Bacteroidetes bacterium]|nr:hypothetical protein [Bacteroidota bacterium]